MKSNDIIAVGKRLWPEQDPTGFNFFDFLHAQGSPRIAIFYSRLFWPDFVEFEGMVFLESSLEDKRDTQRVREALENYCGDKSKTERSFNVIEIPALFGKRSTETTKDEDQLLASQICTMWKARLADLFADRIFEVEVQPPTVRGDEIAVCFYQRR